jgi:multiple sugar transport system substrate-binding protein
VKRQPLIRSGLTYLSSYQSSKFFGKTDWKNHLKFKEKELRLWSQLGGSMKRMFGLFLIVLLTMSVLFAGGTKESSSAVTSEAEVKPVELVVAWWGAQTRNNKFIACFDRYMELNPNVVIETQTNGFSDHMVALSASAASGTLPDVSMSQAAYLAQYVDAGLFLDFTPYIETGMMDASSISKNVLDTGKIGNGIYGITAGINALCIVYNKTLTDSLGITVKDYMTVDEFTDICRMINQKTGVKTHPTNSAAYIEFLARAEGKVLYEENELGVDSYEELLPYFEFIETGIKEGWIIDPTLVVSVNAIEEYPIVNYTTPDTQSWCAMINSNQLLSVATTMPAGIELGITTSPSPDAEKSNYLRQSMCWTVSANSPNVEEAVKLVSWMTNSEEANAIIAGEPGVPASSKMANYLGTIVGSTEKQIMEYITNVVTPKASIGNPNAPANATRIENGLINELVEQVQYGEISAEQAAKTLFTKGNELMQEN